MKQLKKNLKIINQIEKVRKKNNVNWMNILRIAFKNDPKNAKKCFKKISKQDKEVNRLAELLCQ